MKDGGEGKNGPEDEDAEIFVTMKTLPVEDRDSSPADSLSSVEWQATFDAISDLVSIQDRNSRLVKVNRAYAEAFGVSAEELVGRACHELVHGTSEPCAGCPHQLAVKTGRPAKMESFEPHRNVHLEVFASPIRDEAGRITGTVHVARDISDRKRAEEEQAKRERLQGVVEMAGAACHELNQPLQVISGYAELLLRKERDEREHRKGLQAIQSQAERIAEITAKLQRVTRYEVREYVDGTKIIDLDRAAAPPVSSGEGGEG